MVDTEKKSIQMYNQALIFGIHRLTIRHIDKSFEAQVFLATCKKRFAPTVNSLLFGHNRGVILRIC